MGEQVSPGKPFDISKWEVWQAYQKVAANKGAAGVDGVDLAEFVSDLKGNLYKVWNRMSSGSYFPPPVKAVEIPKAHGAGTRMLGVPTIGDRIAQTVVASRLESAAEPKFHPDSYGYRPRKGALDAVGRCRERCCKYDWVIDLDVRKFFDTVPWDRIVAAVEANTALPWVILCVKRWLAAPIRRPDGTLAERDRGTPQGSAVSPVLANLFMHYAFDLWMAREFPTCPFERYADDAVVHCKSLAQARFVLDRLRCRMEQVGVSLHPEKTRIVYCKDGKRSGSHEHAEFTFLGFTFRARGVRARPGRRSSLPGARVAREDPVPAGAGPAGIGAQAEDHASRLQVGDAAVRRVAPVSDRPDRLGRARAGWRRPSPVFGHAGPLRGCPNRSFCDRTINSSPTEVKRNRAGRSGCALPPGGGPAVMLLREPARP